ncbi:MAG: hypothetical protein QOE86_123, partial [Solirubrobacteraceae bacterium]|nr:hypothetical protein [Solirubrobacteraceae bacterium]
RAVRSALEQVPAAPSEVIVVDDASADGTAEAAEAAGARVVRRPAQGGVSAARNAGIRAARQPWIATLDSDDAWLPSHLHTAWQAAPGRVLVSTSALACGDDPAEDRTWGVPRALPLRSPADALVPTNPVVLSGALFARDAALAAGLFPDDVHRSEDLDLWLRLLEHGPGVALPDVTVLYAVHPAQASHDRGAMRDATRDVAAAYRDRPWWSPAVERRLLGAAGWDAFRAALATGDRRAAIGEASRIAASPGRTAGVLALLRSRSALRRVATRVARTGDPTVLVAHDARAARAWAAERFGAAVRESPRSGWREALALWRSPAATVVTGSPLLRAIAAARHVDRLAPPA